MLPLGWQDVFFAELRRTADPRIAVATAIDMGGGGGTGAWATVMGRGVRIVWTGDRSATITIARGPFQSLNDRATSIREFTSSTDDDPSEVAERVRTALLADGARGPLDFPAAEASVFTKDETVETPAGIEGLAEYVESWEAVCKRCNVSHDLFKVDHAAFDKGCPSCHAPRGTGFDFQTRIKAWVYHDPSRLDIESRVAQWQKELFNVADGFDVPIRINVEHEHDSK